MARGRVVPGRLPGGRPALLPVRERNSGRLSRRRLCPARLRRGRGRARPLFELYRRTRTAALAGAADGPADRRRRRRTAARCHGRRRLGRAAFRAPLAQLGRQLRARVCRSAASRAWLDEHLPEAGPVRYAVSPFHQNPSYAVAALADCGYRGLRRRHHRQRSRVPAGPAPARCRWHRGRSSRTARSACCTAIATGATATRSTCIAKASTSTSRRGPIFGYLDHPFSARYQYGWTDEATRVARPPPADRTHRPRPDIWWANINDLLDFLRRRDRVAVWRSTRTGRLAVDNNGQCTGGRPLTIRWKGREIVA